MAVIYARNFESGDFSEFDSNSSSNMTVTFPAGLQSTTACLSGARISGTAFAFGEDTFQITPTSYRIRYFIDDTAATSTGSDTCGIFSGSTAGGTPRLRIYHTYDTGDPTITLRVRNDSESNINITSGTYTRGFHYVEARIVRATGPATADGIGELFLDGTQVAINSSIQNNTIGDPVLLRFGVAPNFNINLVSGAILVDELIIDDEDVEVGLRIHRVGGTGTTRRRRRD